MWKDRVRAFGVGNQGTNVPGWLANYNRVEDEDWNATEDLKRRVNAHFLATPGTGLGRALFNDIVSWKLRQQEDRVADHLGQLNEQAISEVTGAVFRLNHDDPEILARIRIGVLQGMPGVGIGVASAILTLCYPNSYGVIDFRVWDEIHDRDPQKQSLKRQFSISDYLTYLTMIRDFAEQENITVQEVDFALWKIWELRRQA